MDSSEKPEIQPPAPIYSHRPLFHHHHLQLSPHCPQHGGYLLHPNSHHHHHHHTATSHLQISPNCPLHRHLLPHCPLHSSNFHSNNQSTTNFPIIPNSSSIPLNPNFCNPNVSNLNSIQLQPDANSIPEAMVVHDINGEGEDEEEEEFIYELTDEWKEFFAKSEAKRRLAKKQAKRKGKN